MYSEHTLKASPCGNNDKEMSGYVNNANTVLLRTFSQQDINFINKTHGRSLSRVTNDRRAYFVFRFLREPENDGVYIPEFPYFRTYTPELAYIVAKYFHCMADRGYFTLWHKMRFHFVHEVRRLFSASKIKSFEFFHNASGRYVVYSTKPNSTAPFEFTSKERACFISFIRKNSHNPFVASLLEAYKSYKARMARVDDGNRTFQTAGIRTESSTRAKMYLDEEKEGEKPGLFSSGFFESIRASLDPTEGVTTKAKDVIYKLMADESLYTDLMSYFTKMATDVAKNTLMAPLQYLKEIPALIGKAFKLVYTKISEFIEGHKWIVYMVCIVLTLVVTGLVIYYNLEDIINLFMTQSVVIRTEGAVDVLSVVGAFAIAAVTAVSATGVSQKISFMLRDFSNAHRLIQTCGGDSIVTKLIDAVSIKLTGECYTKFGKLMQDLDTAEAIFEKYVDMPNIVQWYYSDTANAEQFYEEFEQMKLLRNSAIRMKELDGRLYASFMSRYRIMEEFDKKVRTSAHAAQNRPKPVVILFSGPPGQGKTFNLERFCAYLHSKFHPNGTWSKTEMHYYNASDQFQSGYRGQMFFIADECWAASSSDRNSDFSLLFQKMTGTGLCKFTMAGLEEKDNTYFTSKFIILTTNQYYDKNTGASKVIDCSGLICPDSLNRRFTIPLEVNRVHGVKPYDPQGTVSFVEWLNAGTIYKPLPPANLATWDTSTEFRNLVNNKTTDLNFEQVADLSYKAYLEANGKEDVLNEAIADFYQSISSINTEWNVDLSQHQHPYWEADVKVAALLFERNDWEEVMVPFSVNMKEVATQRFYGPIAHYITSYFCQVTKQTPTYPADMECYVRFDEAELQMIEKLNDKRVQVPLTINVLLEPATVYGVAPPDHKGYQLIWENYFFDSCYLTPFQRIKQQLTFQKWYSDAKDVTESGFIWMSEYASSCWDVAKNALGNWSFLSCIAGACISLVGVKLLLWYNNKRERSKKHEYLAFVEKHKLDDRLIPWFEEWKKMQGTKYGHWARKHDKKYRKEVGDQYDCYVECCNWHLKQAIKIGVVPEIMPNPRTTDGDIIRSESLNMRSGLPFRAKEVRKKKRARAMKNIRTEGVPDVPASLWNAMQFITVKGPLGEYEVPALFLDHKTAHTNLHSWSGALEISINSRASKKGNIIHKSRVGKGDFTVEIVENRDLVKIHFNVSIHSFAKLDRAYLLSREEHSKIDPSVRIKRIKKNYSGTRTEQDPSCAFKDDSPLKLQATNVHGPYTVTDYYAIPRFVGEVGDCGALYLGLIGGAWKIIGVHFASNVDTCQALAYAIYSDDCSDKGYILRTEWFTDRPCSQLEPQGTLALGRLRKPAASSRRNRVHKSHLAHYADTISSSLPQVPFAPARLGRQIDSEFYHVNDMKPLTPAFYSQTYRGMFDFLFADYLIQRKHEPCFLSKEQAVFGDPELGVDSMDANTSVGPEKLLGASSDWLDKDSNWLDPVVSRLVDEDWLVDASGNISLLVSIDSLKQEPRSLVDEVVPNEEVDEFVASLDERHIETLWCNNEAKLVRYVKPARLFHNCAKSQAIMSKMICWSAFNAFQKQRYSLYHAIGMNVHDSKESTLLVSRMVKHPNNMTFDYSKFDFSHPPWMANLFFRYLNKYYRFEFESESWNLLWAQCQKLLRCVHFKGSLAYQSLGGLPSGAWMTLFFNSFANLVYFQLAILKLLDGTGMCDTLNKHIEYCFFGDDAWITISDKLARHVDPQRLSDMFKSMYDMKLTPADKGEDMSFVSFADVQFLQRRFRVAHGMQRMPMDSTAIWKMLRFDRREHDLIELTIEKIRAFIVEMSHVSPEEYEEFCLRLQPAVAGLLGMQLPHYDELREIACSQL